ncbi:hypothetical protein SUDANB121_03977 [Nocardiopsis dassonvillei]
MEYLSPEKLFRKVITESVKAVVLLFVRSGRIAPGVYRRSSDILGEWIAIPIGVAFRRWGDNAPVVTLG